MSLRYPPDGFAGGGDYVSFQPVDYNSRDSGGGGGGEYITLYMPETTPTIANNNAWGSETVGGKGPFGKFKRDLGMSLAGGLNDISLTEMNSKEVMGQVKGGLRDMVKKAKAGGEGIGKQIATEFIAGQLTMSGNAILQQQQGQIYNPNVEMIYQGPQFRSFGFSFNMIPKSARDAAIIDAIILAFKTESAPQLAGNGGMYKIPKVWLVSYMGAAQAHMNRFKPAALVSISITDNDGYNYYAAHEDGAPVQTTLSLNFKEVDMVLKDDHTGPRGF